MLPRTQRLTTAQFERFFMSGKRFNGPLLQLIYTPAPTFHGAVVVPKKIAKKAVVRNRARRRIYNALYTLSKKENLSGVFIILACTDELMKIPYPEISSQIIELVGRARKSV